MGTREKSAPAETPTWQQENGDVEDSEADTAAAMLTSNSEGGVLAGMIRDLYAEIESACPEGCWETMRESCLACLQQSLELELELATERRKTWDSRKEVDALADHLEATVKRALLHKQRVQYLEDHTSSLKKRIATLQTQLDAASLQKRKATQQQQQLTTQSRLRRTDLSGGFAGTGTRSTAMTSASTMSRSRTSGSPRSSKTTDPIQARVDVKELARLREINAKLEKQLTQRDQQLAVVQVQMESLRDQVEEKARLRQRVRELESQLQAMSHSQLAMRRQQKRQHREQDFQGERERNQHEPEMSACERLRVLVVTAEFVDPIFSGNGVLSRSLCEGLHSIGHSVFVLCARPKDADPPTTFPCHGATHVVTIPVTTWRRLDRYGHWEEMAHGVTPHVIERIKAFSPTTCLFVDWTTLATVRQLPFHNWTFLCFRTFAASTELHEHPDDEAFYIKHERASLELAPKTICLSCADKLALQRLRHTRTSSATQEPSVSQHPGRHIHVLYPPLRHEFAHLPEPATTVTSSIVDSRCTDQMATTTPASTSTSTSTSAPATSTIKTTTTNNGESRQPQSAPHVRRLLCCVRLSPEKGAMRFAEMVAHLREDLRRHNIVPTLCGAVADADYATAVRQALRSTSPNCQVINRFLDARALQQLFRETVINVHPSLHDAFGMTIVEAAACGAVSLVSDDGTVGAVDLFRTTAAALTSQRHTHHAEASATTTTNRPDTDTALVGVVETSTLACAPSSSMPSIPGSLPLLLCDVTNPQACAARIRAFLALPDAEKHERQRQCHAIANSWTRTQYARALANIAASAA
ncbi:hypothetical protein PTSG_01049 [Salpingoeca rosetta]|uniref:Glycosyl transferase family 1 domain-containing protein n=1 Tax=Salpingoeca rosetta (strain ATCC 50818 / BSB-021) TaxID=946362 RepID=F2TY90_SALR5|nr:uncharacterized protein PTSG_01049 [Salpingoeca rosetta]EGD76349.1 hypothetical protein PTSG_01049 [Salpingoeca rosetta]|eukprot:XP_004998524.1 hypothetical protein PTSG_01049 [Salpingoeca rosetta]